MELCFQTGGPSNWSTNAVIAMLFEDEVLEAVYPDLLEAAPWLTTSLTTQDRKGKKDEIIVAYSPIPEAINRIIFVGLGKKEKLTQTKVVERVRNAVGKASVYCRSLGIENFAIPVESLRRFDENWEYVIEEVICAAELSLYRYIVCKSEEGSKDLPADPQWIGLLLTENIVSESIRDAAEKGQIHARAVALARDLDNMPANLLSPIEMAKKASLIAEKYAMSYEVMDREAIIANGMGAFASVAAGSSQEPRLIILEYTAAGHEQDDPIIFVGKGITFDSGGISIKPSSKMEEMKADMSGAGAIIGLFEALGQLMPSSRIIGLLACAENMPDGKATRPGDVVITLSGKTVEIINTDAEGRLVLCDTLAYAQKRWTPKLLIDIATLTGACVVALGDDIAGIFCEDTKFVEQLCDIGGKVGELFWPLPLDDRFFESLKSEVADFKNVGGREGGASSAAIFLKQFILEGTHWAHLDIAGPAFISKKTELCPAGGTGFSVRTLIELVIGNSK